MGRSPPVGLPAVRWIFERYQLFAKHLGVDSHAVAQDAELVLVKNARGDQVKREVLVAKLHRVACVVFPLVARHGVEGRTDHIDYLALPLIPPLHATDDCVGHREPAAGKPA